MRYAALALVLLSLPVFYNMLRSHPRRDWAFWLIGLLLFVTGENVRTEAYFYSWPLWAGTATGFGVSLLDTLCVALILTRRPEPLSLPFWGLLAAFGSVMLLSVFAAPVPTATLFACWQFGRVVLVFAAVGGEARHGYALRGLAAGLSLGMMVQAAFVVQQKLGGALQATGTLPHQNTLGIMTELALMPVIAALLSGDRRPVVFAGLAAAIVILVGGGSRGALAFAFAGAAVAVLLSLARSVTAAKLQVLGVGVLALVLAAPIAFTVVKNRIGDAPLTAGEAQRPAFERAARAMAADHPFGVGANQYVPIANTGGYSVKAGVNWNAGNRAVPPHNAYLLARAELGYLGQIVFTIMLVVPMLRGLYLSFANRTLPGGEFGLAASVAVLGNAIHNTLEFATFTHFGMAILMVNIAIIAAQLRAARGGKTAARPRTRPAALPGGPARA